VKGQASADAEPPASANATTAWSPTIGGSAVRPASSRRRSPPADDEAKRFPSSQRTAVPSALEAATEAATRRRSVGLEARASLAPGFGAIGSIEAGPSTSTRERLEPLLYRLRRLPDDRDEPPGARHLLGDADPVVAAAERAERPLEHRRRERREALLPDPAPRGERQQPPHRRAVADRGRGREGTERRERIGRLAARGRDRGRRRDTGEDERREEQRAHGCEHPHKGKR
jgi:hypothetical protein